jgi:hypothetical protein
VCGAEKIADKQAFFKVLQRDLKGQIFYQWFKEDIGMTN